MPLATQARLLRVLETGEYIRVGGQKILKTDVRIVAATNVNMQKAISESRFREDLYYRLNTIPIQVPPLRDRGNDIILLFRLFAMQMADKYHLPKITLDDDAKDILLKYKWPGNVRQLKNITEQMSVLSEQREIGAQQLLQFIPQNAESTQLATINKPGEHSYETEREILYKILYELRGNVSDLRRDMNSLRKQLDEERALSVAQGFQGKQFPVAAEQQPIVSPDNAQQYSILNSPSVSASAAYDAIAEEINESGSLNLNDLGRQMVEKSLERNGGNRKKAAQELGISDRTLYRRIKQYGLDKE